MKTLLIHFDKLPTFERLCDLHNIEHRIVQWNDETFQYCVEIDESDYNKVLLCVAYWYLISKTERR